MKVSIFLFIYGETKEINIDYEIEDLMVTFEIYDDDDKLVTSGTLEWDSGVKMFTAKVKTEDLLGIQTLKVTAETESKNYEDVEAEVKLLGIGKGEEVIPVWFWPLLFAIIGAAIGMAGYGIKKAIYLRIPYVLRKIDETVKKIEKDKYPAVGVMTGRTEFIINSIIDYLEECGIEWEREDKFEVKKVGEAAAKEKLPPLSLEEIQVALDNIPDISAEEKSLFVEELKRLDRDAQDEFLKSLGGSSEELK